MKVLLVKMSSLGDVVHSLPAVSDAIAAGHEIDWVVEEAFAPIAQAHPGVAKVIPIAWRRWRRHLIRSRQEMAAFRAQLRETRYDLVVDAQGLYKSSAVTWLAQAQQSVGYARDSAREPGSVWAYDKPLSIDPQWHAIDRTRQLMADALDYTLSPELAFGLPVPSHQNQSVTCLFLHGTTWASKHWPEEYWVQLAQLATGAGARVLLPWGSPVEQARAERIQAKAGRSSAGEVVVMPKLSLVELMPELAAADLVVGVDSGLTHLAAAYGLPTVAIYGSTAATLTGVRGPAAASLQADFPCAPCRNRECTYQPPAGEAPSPVSPACYGNIPPHRVWALALQQYPGASRLLPI